MIRTVEAVISEDGNVRLLETIALASARRALVTILEEEPRPAGQRARASQRACTFGGMELAGGGRGMVPSAAGAVVLVRFPVSHLSQAKLGPAVVLADAGRGDRILGQMTSKSYADSRAVEIATSDFAQSSLRIVSYARPGKLFTANQSLLVSEVGRLTSGAFAEVIDAVIGLLRPTN